MAAPGLAHKPWNRSNDLELVGKHVSLAVYGDQDIFTSSKKVRQWAERLSSATGSRFEHVEIEGGGHFWHEDGVVEKLRTALKEWEGRVRD
jgi:pimeloyl-ACP methyl ester carboxylesterase